MDAMIGLRTMFQVRISQYIDINICSEISVFSLATRASPKSEVFDIGEYLQIWSLRREQTDSIFKNYTSVLNGWMQCIESLSHHDVQHNFVRDAKTIVVRVSSRIDFIVSIKSRGYLLCARLLAAW